MDRGGIYEDRFRVALSHASLHGRQSRRAAPSCSPCCSLPRLTKDIPMPAKRPAPRLAVLDEAQMNLASARSWRRCAPGRAAKRSPRAGRSRSGCTRRNTANWHKPSARIAATGPRCRHGCPNSRFCARRGYGARNTSGSRMCRWRRKPASSPQDHQCFARRARADIGAQGRARDLCFHARALQDQARARPRLQARPRLPRRRRRWSNWSASSAIT